MLVSVVLLVLLWQIPAASQVTAIAAGYTHSIVLRADGSVVAWGSNNYRQVDAVNGLTGVATISGGGYHSIVLKRDGTILNGGDISTSIPAGLRGATKAIAASGYVDMALKNDSTVVVWGDNVFNQISGKPVDLKAVFIAGAFHFCVAIKADGTVVAWGDEGGSVAVPPAAHGAVALAPGRYHTLALKGDGSVVTWGRNLSSALSTIPSGLRAKAIAAGEGFSAAVRTDGTVVVWGSQPGGVSVPSGLNSVVAICAGRSHLLALKADGSLVAWGSNNNGQCNIPSNATGLAIEPVKPRMIHSKDSQQHDPILTFNLTGRLVTPALWSAPVNAIHIRRSGTLLKNSGRETEITH